MDLECVSVHAFHLPLAHCPILLPCVTDFVVPFCNILGQFFCSAFQRGLCVCARVQLQFALSRNMATAAAVAPNRK